MRVSFFEEFPNKKNLAKLSLIRWPTKLYLAAYSLAEFEEYKEIALEQGGKWLEEVIYWPLLPKQDGYWISGFTRRSALKHLFDELVGTDVPVMLDLELPVSRNPWLLVSQIFKLPGNKKLISDFIASHQADIYCVEYYPSKRWQETLFRLAGLHFEYPTIKLMKMFYHSVHHFDEEFFREQLHRGVSQKHDDFIPCYGTIATGIQGTEKILAADQFRRDLEIAKEYHVSEAVIFRLAGLNKEYVKTIKEVLK